MTSTITNLLPQITSIQNQISSIDAILATATASAEVIDYARLEEKLGQSLSILVNQEFIATATSTATAELAAATANIATAQSALSSMIEAHNLYGMHPSYGGNLAMSIVMGIFLAIHSGLGIWYRAWWFGISYFCGCGLELAGYVGRTLSAHQVDNINFFLVQIITLTIAPCFIMAGCYFLLGQLIVVYGSHFAILKPIYYSYIFITCDVISLVIQAVGGAMAAINLVNYESPDSGTNVMVAGLAFQVVSMSVFILLFVHFLLKIQYFHAENYQKLEEQDKFNIEYKSIRSGRLFKIFPVALALAVTFVFIRCIYRVIELAQGWDGYLITHEAYFMVLDALMMSLACLVFIPFHPGFVFGKTAIKIVNTKKNRRTINNKEYEISEVGTDIIQDIKYQEKSTYT